MTRTTRDLAPPIVENEFVRREGSVLTLGGKPFRFSGNNVYFNQADIVYGRIAAVEESVDKMAVLGMSVARFNANNDNDPARDPAAIQLTPGVFVESSLVALDRSVALAKTRNIRLILKLTNNWDAYGGIRRYVAWHLGRAPVQNEWGLFYTEPRIKTWFRNYIQMLLDRRNTVTGFTYRNEPAILAWELGNELRNPGRADDLVAWSGEMAAFIKQLDSNHLVADGGEGFDDAPNLYIGLGNRYAVSGSDGCSYHRLAAIPALDMLSYHLYPASWQLNDTTDTALFIRRHEEIARENGKVAYLGEFGKRANDRSPANCAREPGRAFDPQRAAIYNSWLQTAALSQASSGVMVWQLINDGKEDCEGFQVYCPQDGESCNVLRQAAETITQSPVAVSAASYEPITLAPATIATLFGINLDNTQLTIVDSANRSQEATIFFANATQINFLIPESAATGSALIRVIRNGAIQSSAPLMLANVAPGIFTAAFDGKGYAAGHAVYSEGQQKFVPIPIAFPAEGGAIVTLYGTGIRGDSGAAIRANGQPAEILYAGPQHQYQGLDQVNLRLPRALIGAGDVDLVLTVAGKPANAVRVAIQ